jgi:hypothetical protein
MGSCYSGWTIFLIVLLLGILNGATLGSGLLGIIILIGGILFYMNQRSLTGCTYPDPNA